ncbi:MAG: cysteine synthase A [Oscillospiraceae bacterium]|nr:cysteine synthase A [Oscillospiraceae bacterium]
MKIYNNILELIGNTPLIKLDRYQKANNVKANLLAKIESFNPAGSVKDRIAYWMIKDAEEKGFINQKTTIIEPTSGNTGIGLACVCSAKGYKLILTMPSNMSIERQKLLKAYGAEVILTEPEKGMAGAIEEANKLSKNISNSFVPSQFTNMANVDVHEKFTGPEIWNDTDGNVDIFVVGLGTGGTATGVGKYLKSKKPEIKIIGIEPFDSPVITKGKKGPHKIQGIGPGFIPEILNRDIIDEIVTIKTEEAYESVRNVLKTEGLLIGISAGAALHIATEVGKKDENIDKNIVLILPDSGERYLSLDLFG